MTGEACLGGATEPARMGHEHAEKCRACGTMVRHDLTEHPLFGFAASCSQTRECTFNVQDMHFGRCCNTKPSVELTRGHAPHGGSNE